MHGPGSHLRHDFGSKSKRVDERGGGGLRLCNTVIIIEVMSMKSTSCRNMQSSNWDPQPAGSIMEELRKDETAIIHVRNSQRHLEQRKSPYFY